CAQVVLGEREGGWAEVVVPRVTRHRERRARAGGCAGAVLVPRPDELSVNAAKAESVKGVAAETPEARGACQMTAYTATQVIADGIKGAGSEDPTKVAKYLHANSFDTPIGKVSWNKQGDLTNFQFDVFVWHKDGSKSVYK
ncbi:ABC transporter substrate-binding protein, partial [Achromobacter ruhlandii]